MLRCKDCEHFRKDHPAGFFTKEPESDLYLCERFNYYVFSECVCVSTPDDEPEDDDVFGYDNIGLRG